MAERDVAHAHGRYDADPLRPADLQSAPSVPADQALPQSLGVAPHTDPRGHPNSFVRGRPTPSAAPRSLRALPWFELPGAALGESRARGLQ
ncbi:hypothetical protein SAMN05428944_3494 [Streptomyces sp. 1222.5]|nr:hypothetical protein BX260_4599 [Streptomyces sp. 5112.2]SEC37583.1 hypothetical protein SAMN05428944_3494 [Streptomyces sp. 1222.5]